MFRKVKSLWSTFKEIDEVRAEADRKGKAADSKHKAQVEQLQEEIKLRDIQIKNLVAENQRNFERIKAETAAFSADVVKSTMHN